MGKRPPAAATRVNLIRVMDLLQTHIASALCQTIFRGVRRTENRVDRRTRQGVGLRGWARARPSLGRGEGLMPRR